MTKKFAPGEEVVVKAHVDSTPTFFIGKIDGPAHPVHGDDLWFVDGVVDDMAILVEEDRIWSLAR